MDAGRCLLTICALSWTGCLIGSGELVVEPAEPPIVIETGDGSMSNPNGAPQGQTPSDEDPWPTPDDPSPDNGSNSTPGCEAPQMFCDGRCVFVGQNDEHCGECNNSCDGGRVCIDRDCTCEVGEFCDGACVDTTSTFAHCGMCDRACVGGEACVAGDCVVVTEIEGVILGFNAARATGADCGAEGVFGPTSPLEGDPNLHIAAQAHADDMAANGFFSHIGSDGSSFSQRIGRTAFSGQPIGENIAGGGRTAQDTVNQWLGSDGHCANLMNPAATKVGVGYTEGGQAGTLWVTVFAR